MTIAQTQNMPRQSLDELVAALENDVKHRLHYLEEHYRAYAESLLSVSAPSDRKYVLGRIKDIFRTYGMIR